MSESLGTATLDLDADLGPLEIKLARGEQRVATSVAVMQRMLASLHADVDVRANAIEAAAARIAESAIPASQPVAGPGAVAGRNEIWGIRGPEHPGSMQNPIVFIMEAARFTPLGSYAAAVGEASAQDVQRGDQSSGVASALDLAALTAAVDNLARNVGGAAPSAPAGETATEPAGERPVVALQDTDSAALRQAAESLASLDRAGKSGAGPDRSAVVLADLLRRAAAGETTPALSHSATSTTIIWGGPNGRGSSTSPIPMMFGGEGGQGGGPIGPVAVGGAGGGGNRRVDVFYHSSNEGGGGGGGMALLPALGWGGGIAGMAGFGSLLSFAGFDFAHVITTALGILGSATSAAAGGGLLALGSAGKLGVGMGSDAAVMSSTIADTRTLSQDMTSLAQAQAIYGKNSTQAAQATAQLNYDMATLGNTAGVRAEAGLAKATTALNSFWDAATSNARVQAVSVLMQGVQAGYTFIPLVARAAARNLAIIDQGVRPLFSWVEGPQGIQIFNDLENAFARELPTGVHAFDQALELLLRVVDIASQYTGGFVGHLDRLFTRLNSMDNAQLGLEIQKLVDDFRLWDTFVKLLIIDIYDLFHHDVGTGNSIIASLTGMLEKLHAYETSARGGAQLENIFMVHKTEVLELLKLLPELGSTLGHVYMDVAPAAVAAMNDVVLPILNDIGKALAFIAKQSPLAGDVLGLMLIGMKMGGVAGIVGLARGGTQFLLGTGGADAAGAAAGAAEAGAGGAATVTAMRGLPGLLGRLGAFGASDLGAGLTAEGIAGAVASGVSFAIPALGAALGGYLLVHALAAGAGFRTVTPQTVSVPTRDYGRFGTTPAQLGNPGGGLNIQAVGNFANYSADQLRQLIVEMKAANGLQLNGVNVPKQQLIGLAEAALRAKDAFNRSFNEMWSDVYGFYRDSGRTLPALVDDFDSNTKLIAHLAGLNSNLGREMFAENIQKMVGAVTTGMLDGKIGVTQGLAAINRAIQQGMQDNAITWDGQWRLMFTTVTGLYAHHKIDTQQFLSQLRSINKDAVSHIQTDTQQSYQRTFANLKAQYDDGLITEQQFQQKSHQAWVAATAQEKGDLKQYAGNVLTAMFASGSATLAGATAVVKELNQVLGPLGAAKIPLPTAVSVAVSNAVVPAANAINSFVGGGFAGGGLMQIGQRGQAGRDTVPLNLMVGDGEQVAVFNRHQQPIMDAALSLLGYDGLTGLFGDVSTPNYMASGGIAAPKVGGSGALATIVAAGLGMLAKDANAYAGKHAGAGGESGRAGSTAGLSGSLVAMVHQIAARMGWGPGLIQDWLNVISVESGGSMIATNQSSGAYGIAQMNTGTGVAAAKQKYYQYGGNPNTMAGQLIAMANYMQQTYGGPAGAWASEMTRHSYARGGLPIHASTGFLYHHLPGQDTTAAKPSSASPDIAGINAGIADLRRLLGPGSTDPHGITYLNELLSYWPGIWAAQNPTASQIMSNPSAAIVTQDALGNPVTPYVDETDLHQAIRWLTKLVGWEEGVDHDLRWGATASTQLLAQVRRAIAQRKQKIAALRAQNATLNKRIKAEKNAATRKAWSKQVGANNAKISQLTSEIGAANQTGLTADLALLENPSGTFSVDAIQGVTGLGGEQGPAATQLATYSAELGALSPSALATALATANAQSSSSTASQLASQLASLLEQQNEQLGQALYVSQQQYGVLANLPPFGGSFATGGVVPGPIGEPRTIIAHGGEAVGQPAGDVRVHMHFARGMEWLRDFVRCEVEQGTRRMARNAARGLPSRGGGQLAVSKF